MSLFFVCESSVSIYIHVFSMSCLLRCSGSCLLCVLCFLHVLFLWCPFLKIAKTNPLNLKLYLPWQPNIICQNLLKIKFLLNQLVKFDKTRYVSYEASSIFLRLKTGGVVQIQRSLDHFVKCKGNNSAITNIMGVNIASCKSTKPE